MQNKQYMKSQNERLIYYILNIEAFFNKWFESQIHIWIHIIYLSTMELNNSLIDAEAFVTTSFLFFYFFSLCLNNSKNLFFVVVTFWCGASQLIWGHSNISKERQHYVGIRNLV